MYTPIATNTQYWCNTYATFRFDFLRWSQSPSWPPLVQAGLPRKRIKNIKKLCEETKGWVRCPVCRLYLVKFVGPDPYKNESNAFGMPIAHYGWNLKFCTLVISLSKAWRLWERCSSLLVWRWPQSKDTELWPEFDANMHAQFSYRYISYNIYII